VLDTTIRKQTEIT